MVNKKVTLNLGLVKVSVGLTAARRTDTKPRLVSVCCGPSNSPHPPSQISAPYMCATCGEVPRASCKKGKKVGDDFILVSAEEVKALKAETSQQFATTLVLAAHPADQVTAATQQGNLLYYVEPIDDTDRPGYGLFVHLVKAHPELAFCTMYTPRSNAAFFQLRLYEDVLILEERTQTAGLKAAPEVSATPNPEHLELAEFLLTRVVSDYDPASYEDAYADRLRELLESREAVTGTTPTATTAATPVAADDSIMAALKAMLAS